MRSEVVERRTLLNFAHQFHHRRRRHAKPGCLTADVQPVLAPMRFWRLAFSTQLLSASIRPSAKITSNRPHALSAYWIALASMLSGSAFLARSPTIHATGPKAARSAPPSSVLAWKHPRPPTAPPLPRLKSPQASSTRNSPSHRLDPLENIVRLPPYTRQTASPTNFLAPHFVAGRVSLGLQDARVVSQNSSGEYPFLKAHRKSGASPEYSPPV